MKRILKKSIFKLALPLIAGMAIAGTAFPFFDSAIQIPAGRPIQVDGTISHGEWDDAGSVNIQVEPDWIVTVLYKHDVEHLYLAFRNTRHGKVRLYPEVLIDSQNLKTDSWQPGQWWLHASYNLCEAEGAYRAYSCSHTKSGWDANNPPGSDVVEFQIELAKIGLRPNATFGIAFDVTDATGDFKQRWSLWPAFAGIRTPKTWGEAKLVQQPSHPGPVKADKPMPQ